jgi:hypothetical protein
MNKKIIVTLISMLLIAGVALTNAQFSEKMVSTSEIENLIQQRLEVGDDVEIVEDFLKAQDWSYVYDRDLHRFQARDMKEDELPDIVGRNLIYIHMDEQHKLKRFEVMRIFP